MQERGEYLQDEAPNSLYFSSLCKGFHREGPELSRSRSLLTQGETDFLKEIKVTKSRTHYDFHGAWALQPSGPLLP